MLKVDVTCAVVDARSNTYVADKVELMSAISMNKGEFLRASSPQRHNHHVHERMNYQTNPIVHWVLSRGNNLTSYLDHLLKFDQRLGGESGTPFTLARVRRRLSLALFLDYSRDHGLSADEMASLLDDAQRTASEAMSFLITAARSNDTGK